MMFITSWRNNHPGETIRCADCGATTPRLTWNTKRCEACQYPYKLRYECARSRRRRAARKAAK